MKSQSVLDRFCSVLKQSMQEFISETMNDKIKTALFDRPNDTPGDSSDPVQPAGTETTLAPTQGELEAHYHLKNLFKDYINLEDITYKKTESYLWRMG